MIILARGGGDATQLLPWSDEELCWAIAACPVTVVSAIGHDGDRPLCDEVADVRCGTPSMAAQLVVPDRVALTEELDRLVMRAGAGMAYLGERSARRLAAVDAGAALRGALRREEERLGYAARELGGVHPRRELVRCGQRLESADWRRPAGERFGAARGRLDAEGRHLRALSPQHVLERGYSVVRGADHEVVRRAGQVAAGDVVHIRLAAGRLTARVEETADE